MRGRMIFLKRDPMLKYGNKVSPKTYVYGGMKNGGSDKKNHRLDAIKEDKKEVEDGKQE